MVTPTRNTTRAAVPDHQILAAATAGVMSTHATAALVNAPWTLVSANLSPSATRWTLSPIVRSQFRRPAPAGPELAVFDAVAVAFEGDRAALSLSRGIERAVVARPSRDARPRDSDWRAARPPSRRGPARDGLSAMIERRTGRAILEA
jgi:hypothetical protein